MKLHINDSVKVRLTQQGNEYVTYSQHDKLNSLFEIPSRRDLAPTFPSVR